MLKNEIEKVWYVSLYLTDRAFGGAEEGGWWYNTGEFISNSKLNKMFTNHESAMEYKYSIDVQEELEKMNEGRHDKYSVLSDGEYEIYVEDEFPHSFPEEFPHYE